ncbi:MAG: LuxR C-terminal-related transcriptional regulator [Pseudonocardia sp.]
MTVSTAQAPLIATKLFVPRARADLVARPRLTARLAAADGCTLVSAPAGAGKTTLLGGLLAGRAQPVAWLSLDARDQDVRRFLRYLVAALQHIDPACGASALAWLDGPPTPPEVLLTSLVNDLAVLPDGSVVVLDDYHLVHAAEIHAAVTFLLEHLPPCLRLVIATREDPPLPLPRLRGRGELTEIRAADLSFAVDEARALLVDGMGVPLDLRQVGALVERTEGWAAGLLLAGLALRDHPDPGGFIEAFAGSHRLVADYLAAEVLDRQPPEVQRFLQGTAVLDRMCAPLCAAVLQGAGPDPQELLEGLDRANLFVVALDDERRWFRYHHLLAEVLRARDARDVDAAAGAHLRASEWFAGEGLLPEAIEHALVAGSVEDAAGLIESLVPVIFASTDLHEAMRDWLTALPDPLVRARPMLCLVQAWLMVDRYEIAAAAAWAEAAAQALPEGGGSRVAGAVFAMQALLAPHGSDPGLARGLAQRALAELAPDEIAFRVVALLALGQALLGQDLPDDAEQAFAQAAAAARCAGLAHAALNSTHHEVWVQRAVGERRRALRTARAALRWAAARLSPAAPAVGLLSVLLADLECDGTDVAAARRLATDGLAVLGRYPQLHVIILLASLTLVRVCLADGDAAAAQAALGQARTLVDHDPAAGLAVLLDAAQAQAQLVAGEVAAAVAWAVAESAPLPDFFRFSSHLQVAGVEALVLTPARILATHGRAIGDPALLRRAAERLEYARSITAERSVGVLRVPVLALQALVLDGLGDREAALDALVAAVTAAAPEGIVRPFVEGGAPMAVLLALARKRAEADPAGRQPADLDVLLAALRPARAPLPVTDGLIEPLTVRERDVLALLVDGRSNAEIARSLVVEQSTVKTHLGHVYRKLGVRGRTRALARVRELRLFDRS